MSKTKRARYTLEFKLEAVRLVKAGQRIAAAAAALGVPGQSISNWVKAEQEGKLGGAGTKPVSAEPSANLASMINRMVRSHGCDTEQRSPHGSGATSQAALRWCPPQLLHALFSLTVSQM